MKYRTAKKILCCVPVRAGGVRLSHYRWDTIIRAQITFCRRNARVGRSEMARINKLINKLINEAGQ